MKKTLSILILLLSFFSTNAQFGTYEHKAVFITHSLMSSSSAQPTLVANFYSGTSQWSVSFSNLSPYNNSTGQYTATTFLAAAGGTGKQQTIENATLVVDCYDAFLNQTFTFNFSSAEVHDIMVNGTEIYKVNGLTINVKFEYSQRKFTFDVNNQPLGPKPPRENISNAEKQKTISGISQIKPTGSDNNNEELKIYPNPTSGGQVTLLQGGNSKGERAQIYSLSGVVVATADLDDKQVTMDISNLAPGIYLVRVWDKEAKTVTSARLVKTE